MQGRVMNKPMSRWRAAALHLGVSIAVATLVFAVIFFVWYPSPLFESAGGRHLFLVVAMVDVTIGPLITLIVFRAGKRGMRFDLATIAVMQVAALSYGVWVLYEARPVWIVFVKDRFELVRANNVMDAELAKAKPPFAELPLRGPELAGARAPTNPDEQFRIAMSAMAGQDLHTYPQYLIPYAEVKRSAASRSQPLKRLAELNPGLGPEVERLVKGLGKPEAQVRFLPMRAGKVDLSVLVDATTGDVLRITALRPWEY
jgi:hypothetical protein